MATSVGPLIDADAYKRVRDYVELAPTEGRVVLDRSDDVPDKGWFVGPTVVADVKPGSRLATEEIFGPVLSVMRATDFDDAIAVANDTEYALTAGVVSRSPAHIRRAVEELRAGNVYVNRAITGAVVGRQPFGGYGMSGVGSKAGGPDYLLQFLEPRAVTREHPPPGLRPGRRGRGGLFLASAGSCRALVVDATGLEPATSCVSSRRSTGLSYTSGLPASMIVRRPRLLRRVIRRRADRHVAWRLPACIRRDG